MLIGSDKLVTPRSRAGRTAVARCLTALPAALGALAFAFALAGCGDGSHAAGPASAAVNGAAAAGATNTVGARNTAGATSTAGARNTAGATSTAGAPTSTTQSGTTPTATTTASGQGQGSGAGAGGPGAGTGTIRNGPNHPATGPGGSSAGKGAAHGKSKPSGKTGAGSGVGATGSSTGTGSGSGGAGSGTTPPSANTGVPYEVETSSMEPTFQPEKKIYYDPTRTHPQIGEVVVFYLPAGAEEGACGTAMVGGRACSEPVPGQTKSKLISLKRVVGLPGDSISIHEARVIRNGQPEPEPPILPCGKAERVECEFPTAITVPAGHYYVMADNRGLPKEDSRIFGAVPQEYILGTVEGG